MLFQALLSSIVPVLDLQTNKNADHDDSKVDKYGEPILRSDMLSYTAQQHNKKSRIFESDPNPAQPSSKFFQCRAAATGQWQP